MTREENIKSILECHFTGFKEELIDNAVKCICDLSDDGEYIKRSDLDNTIIRLNNEGWEITGYEYKRIDRVLFEMPTYSFPERKGEWIPVSERLPEEREWYLAVFKEKDTNFQLIPRVADYIGYGENKWRLIDEEGMVQEYFDLLECVAWQPLPEPYTRGKADE